MTKRRVALLLPGLLLACSGRESPTEPTSSAPPPPTLTIHAAPCSCPIPTTFTPANGPEVRLPCGETRTYPLTAEMFPLRFFGGLSALTHTPPAPVQSIVIGFDCGGDGGPRITVAR